MTAADDRDRTEWERAWRSMEHRSVPDPSVLEIGKLVNDDFGVVASSTITRAPEQFVDLLYFSSEECILCSMMIEEQAQKIPASLNLKFESINSLGFSVWVHRKCFEALPLSKDTGPIPW